MMSAGLRGLLGALTAGEAVRRPTLVIGDERTASRLELFFDLAFVLVVAQLAGVYPFVLEVASEIKTVNDLKGKKVGVSSVGSSSDIATRVALKKMGLDPEKDVSILAVGSAANRVAALFAGSIQGGVSQPPDSLDLEAKGFHVLYDLASQKLPSANTSVAVRRSYIAQNKDVVQRYVDAIVLGIKKLKSDKAFGISVLKKYFNSTDDAKMGVTYDFFVGNVTPQYPVVDPALFGDAVEQLSATNDKIKSFDLNSILDNSFVQSAMDRHVGAP